MCIQNEWIMLCKIFKLLVYHPIPGKDNIIWPGLTVPVLRGRELVQQQKLPEDQEREKKLIKLRDSMGNFRPLKLSPIERGWSGVKMPGRSIGPPDPVGEGRNTGLICRYILIPSAGIYCWFH